MEEGVTFKYDQLGLEQEEFSAATKAISRMVSRQEIKRITSGVFYKPQKTVFGELKPRESEIMKAFLFEKKSRIGYVTGISLYNKMGLTTQVPRVIQVASKKKRISVTIGRIKTKPVKSYVDITDENVPILEILDALKDFAKIPDLDKEMGIKLLLNKIKNLKSKDESLLIKYALDYPPRTRAFLGALLEKGAKNKVFLPLKDSLNPLTSYDFGIDENMLETSLNWNIK